MRLPLLAALLLLPTTALAQSAKVSPVLQQDLPDFPGKEAVMVTVEYAPGASDPVHHHNAHVLIYVLEGAIVMQVKGQAPVRLTPGQGFYEAPADVHVVGRNDSTTAPAKFLAVFLKTKTAPRLIPGEPAK